ncbi:MAG: cupredoxin domain-containing protein [Bdellovibrionota bacterium]
MGRFLVTLLFSVLVVVNILMSASASSSNSSNSSNNEWGNNDLIGPDEDFPPARFGRAPFRGNIERNLANTENSKPPSSSLATLAPKELPPAQRAEAGLANGLLPVRGVQEAALIAGDLGFFPKTLFVSRGTPVRLFVTGISKNTLCIMMDSFQVRRQIRSNKIEEITFTPTFPGKFRFYCPLNGTEGLLVVKELASANADQPEE